MAEIEKFWSPERIQSSAFREICVGKGQKITSGRTLETYFVVIESSELLQLRRELEAELFRRGNKKFRATAWQPHITLGFDERDLHEVDGIRKDSSSCVFPLQRLHR